MLSFVSQLLSTLGATIPTMLKQAVLDGLQNNKHLLESGEDQTIDDEALVEVPAVGDLLFPAYNSVVPQMTEHVIPNLPLLSSKESSVIIGTFYQMIEFAFRT